MERAGQRYYYNADGLGSVAALTDSTGQLVRGYPYAPFGMNGTVLSPELLQPYAFTGREYDQETGLYYYRNRYYDVNTGRFMSKDPIGFSAGDVNLYRYVGNNPVNKVDPLGLEGTGGPWHPPAGLKYMGLVLIPVQNYLMRI